MRPMISEVQLPNKWDIYLMNSLKKNVVFIDQSEYNNLIGTRYLFV